MYDEDLGRAKTWAAVGKKFGGPWLPDGLFRGPILIGPGGAAARRVALRRRPAAADARDGRAHSLDMAKKSLLRA